MGDKTGRFKRSDRLLDSRDFRRVLRRGRRYAHRDIVAIVVNRGKKTSKNGELINFVDSGSRLGITASRKTGNAVVRNRFKRRVRHWFRLRREEFPADLDLVVIARRSGASLSFTRLDSRLSMLMGLSAAASPTRSSEIARTPRG